MKFKRSSQHSPSRDVNQALSTLQRIFRSMTGELRSLDKESALLEALQRRPVTSISRYQVYTDFSRDALTAVFIHTPSGEEQHKYVLATRIHTFIIAAPMRWTFLHKNIVARVMASTEDAVFCSGGGFVSIETDGKLREGGASSGCKEFGNWVAICDAPPGGPLS
jgi:hypothetical protein